MKRRTFTLGAGALIGAALTGTGTRANEGAPVQTALRKLVVLLTLVGIYATLLPFMAFMVQLLVGFRGLLSRPRSDFRALVAITGSLLPLLVALSLLLVFSAGSPVRRSRGLRAAQNFQRRNKAKAQAADTKAKRIGKRLDAMERKLDGQISSVKDARSTVQTAKRDADRNLRANRNDVTDKDRANSSKKVAGLRAEIRMYRTDMTQLRGLGTNQAAEVRSHLRNAASIGRNIKSATNEATMYGRRMKVGISAGDVDALDAYAPKFDALGARLNGYWGQMDRSLSAANKAMGKLEGTQRKLGTKVGSSLGRISRDTGVRIGLRITF